MDKFFKENNKWLSPAIGTLMVVMAPLFAGMIGIHIPIPAWMSIAIITFGLTIVGYGLFVTNTFAAKVATFVISAVLLAALAIEIFG